MSTAVCDLNKELENLAITFISRRDAAMEQARQHAARAANPEAFHLSRNDTRSDVIEGHRELARAARWNWHIKMANEGFCLLVVDGPETGVRPNFEFQGVYAEASKVSRLWRRTVAEEPGMDLDPADPFNPSGGGCSYTYAPGDHRKSAAW
jgi:hypothetical protein